MDLERLRDRAVREQWKVGDLDWSRPPPELSAEDEQAVVQLFTDMAGIERLAAALFREQARRTRDPVLREIFEIFVADEIRHSHAAQMLADHYDVHHYRLYQPNPHLVRFGPHFVHALRFLSAEIANVYVTTGELILDVALLRSIDDFVADGMSHEVIRLVNRDESRHIAVDFHMVEHYASEAYQRELADAPPMGFADTVRAWWAFANVLRFARPFFREVFFEPMDRCDPGGRRIVEAFRRIQMLQSRPEVARRPFTRFLTGMQALYETPVVGRVLGRGIVRVMGIDPRVLVTLTTEEDVARARRMTFSELAREALSLKHAPW